jgi:hypothetical protein
LNSLGKIIRRVFSGNFRRKQECIWYMMKIAVVTEVTHATAEQMKKTSAKVQRIAFKILKKKQVQLESTMKTALFSEEMLAIAGLMQKRVKITMKRHLRK